MSPTVYSFVVSDELKVPPTANEVEGDERRELMLSDRKVSKVLGVTVLRAPRLTIDRKASKILGTNVVRSGVDWETRLSGGFVGPRRNRLGEKSLMTKVAPLILGGLAERERVSGKEGQKVVLSPKWKSSRMLRRHTISCESGLNLVLSSTPSSPTSMTVTLSPTASTFAELPPEDGGEGSDSGLDLDVALEETASETATLVDLGIVPLPVPTSCPPSPICPLMPLPVHGASVSLAAMKNPVLQRRREMIRSANKSVQILGIEARREILERMEKENAGRIGWSGV